MSFVLLNMQDSLPTEPEACSMKTKIILFSSWPHPLHADSIRRICARIWKGGLRQGSQVSREAPVWMAAHTWSFRCPIHQGADINGLIPAEDMGLWKHVLWLCHVSGYSLSPLPPSLSLSGGKPAHHHGLLQLRCRNYNSWPEFSETIYQNNLVYLSFFVSGILSWWQKNSWLNSGWLK